MIQKNNKELALIIKQGKEISSVLYKNIEVWSAANFKTFDNFIFITADNKTFNVNDG